MTKNKGIISIIERWIADNYIPKQKEIPKVYDRSKEIYWKIGEYVYGPIFWSDIPDEIKSIK